ncbi:hypothetical protein ACFV2I_35430 [Streptomyces microflavus]|uniref:hypothetical protein n=1 Tax=Streptomyces microflavus TaxID=1919 RepID=UPI00369F977F
MDHISDHVLRALWYLDSMASQGIVLTRNDVNRIATVTPPRDTIYRSFLNPLAGSALFESTVPSRRAQPVATYLVDVDWASETPEGLKITNKGRAILRLSGADEHEHAVNESVVNDVALSPDDPLVYTVLTRRLAAAGEGMLVDPYFKAENLRWIVEATSLKRILISKKASAKERPIISVALGTLPNGQSVEVRATDDANLHDRRIIAADGSVQMIGTSINGIGRHETAMISPEPAIAKAYRDSSEQLWTNAEKVEPRQLKAPVETDEASDRE